MKCSSNNKKLDNYFLKSLKPRGREECNCPPPFLNHAPDIKPKIIRIDIFPTA